jgi:hypothetical protein
MNKCIICNKEFLYPYLLDRHKNNINPCDSIKESYNCDLCKADFNHKSHLERHNKTKKHIENESKNNTNNKVKNPLDEFKLKEDIKTLEYVYLLQERTAVALNKQIYKIGRTNQSNFERFKGYHKGYKILLHVVCNDCKDIEQKIIDLFIKNYNHYTEYGNEYFEGNYKSMIKDIFSLIV